MPRGKGRGGPRQGTAGKQYPNRRDMQQAPRAVPGQTYGEAGAQLAAQRAIPLPTAAAPMASGAGAAPTPSAQGLPGGGAPLTPVNAPTQRLDEPLTTGIASGPGAGPEALNLPVPQDPTLATLKGILSRYPNPDLEALVRQAELLNP